MALGSVLALVAWVPPLVDQLWGSGNLSRTFDDLSQAPPRTVGLGTGLGVVSAYARPGGGWTGGSIPIRDFSVAGSGPVWAGLLAALLVVAIMTSLVRGDGDTAAGACLALVVVVAAVPLVARLEAPISDYLVVWLVVVSAFAWCWVGVALWRSAAGLSWRPTAATAAAVGVSGIVAASSWSVWRSADREPLFRRELRAADAVIVQLDRVLPRDRPIDLEFRGDQTGQIGASVVPALLRSGHDVRTSDGAEGQKYGLRVASTRPGGRHLDTFTLVVTLAGSLRGLEQTCDQAPGTRRVAHHDRLGGADRDWLTDYIFRVKLADGPSTPAEDRRADGLTRLDVAVDVFAGPEVCAPPP